MIDSSKKGRRSDWGCFTTETRRTDFLTHPFPYLITIPIQTILFTKLGRKSYSKPFKLSTFQSIKVNAKTPLHNRYPIYWKRYFAELYLIFFNFFLLLLFIHRSFIETNSHL